MGEGGRKGSPSFWRSDVLISAVMLMPVLGSLIQAQVGVQNTPREIATWTEGTIVSLLCKVALLCYDRREIPEDPQEHLVQDQAQRITENQLIGNMGGVSRA
jgi:hypothetical protein